MTIELYGRFKETTTTDADENSSTASGNMAMIDFIQ